MADPIKIRAALQGDTVEVRILMTHEMESGTRKDADGKPIPAHFIQTVSIAHNGAVIVSGQWGPAVSKNPFMLFKFRGARQGDRIQVSWTDNKGDRRTDEALVS